MTQKITSDFDHSAYPRDLKGYADTPPKANWPGGARIAVQFVLNIEEGAENSIIHGDSESERFLSDILGTPSFNNRHQSIESAFEYGSRVGVWRVLDVFKEYYTNPNIFSKMSISAVDGIYFVNIKDMVRLEGEDNYTHIYLENKQKITVSKTIKWYADLLENKNFFRVHKKHVINLNYMQKFVKGEGGYLIMDDEKEIEVSRRRRPAFIQQLKNMQMGM